LGALIVVQSHNEVPPGEKDPVGNEVPVPEQALVVVSTYNVIQVGVVGVGVGDVVFVGVCDGV
jgi:hypothetical protein